MKSEHSREDRKRKSCRSKINHNNEIQEEVKILKDQIQKNRIEREYLRKEVEKLNIVLKQVCKIAETQTSEIGSTSEIGGQQTSEIGSTSEIGGQQESINSPRGFWPHPSKELFYKQQTPWKVPRKRKSRGRSKLYYDHELESVQYKQCEEVSTFNRFQALSEEDSTLSKTSPQEEKNPLEEYTETDSLNKFLISDNKNSNNNFFMYKQNKNFCSGYFPDFITLHDPMYYQLSNSQNHNFYFLKIQNGKYLKYLSNRQSRYDNAYFNNMNVAYRISKKYSNIPLISDNSEKKKKK